MAEVNPTHDDVTQRETDCHQLIWLILSGCLDCRNINGYNCNQNERIRLMIFTSGRQQIQSLPAQSDIIEEHW